MTTHSTPPPAPAPTLQPIAELLAHALEDGTVQIDEVSEAGSVPNVRVTNRGAQNVLFLFGEEIRGARRNRIANASFLVPAQSELWHDIGERLAHAGTASATDSYEDYIRSRESDRGRCAHSTSSRRCSRSSGGGSKRRG